MKLSAQRWSAVRVTAWTALPQVVTRLVSFYVFAVVAHAVTPNELGAFTIGVAVSGVPVALAPALIGNPLARTREPGERTGFGRLSCASAVWLGLAAAVPLAIAAVPTGGLVRLALLSGAIGLPATMVVEATFWRALFVESRPTAALRYVAAYVTQAVLVTLANLLLDGHALVLAAFASLVVPAVILLVRSPDLGLGAAATWLQEHRGRWWPYVMGNLAGLGVAQAIPIVLSAAAGFEAAGVYRAGELAYGGVNLAIGVAIQMLLTRDNDDVRRTYVAASGLLLLATAFNAAVILVLPMSVLKVFFGSATPMLIAVFWIFTVQRAALAVSTVGNMLLVQRLSAFRMGLLDVSSAAISFTLLIVGAVVLGLRGGIGGIAVAEILVALIAAYILRRNHARA